MSRLRELRLHGFKTFAEPTRFVFEPGVNAVIGPNGSGKSNMADAVRWVLGEQSNRSLRTRRADDVIFAGSEQRKPTGLAEVVLTLDNADGWLPIDFGEVTIGRRAYRSGEGEYLINDARVRLREVVELLGAGQLGASSLVVVGQGTVDAALSLRPEERRQLFEEAAGVKNLQVRKNESLGRLARAEENLSRVSDLLGELRPQVRRLALQAEHQQEHDSLGLRGRALVQEGYRRRDRDLREALGDARRRVAAAEAAGEALRSELASGREAVAAAESRYWEAEAAARRAAAEREGTREAVIRLEARAQALTLRQDELEESLSATENALHVIAEAPTPEQEEGERPEIRSAIDAAAATERRWLAAVAALAAADEELLAAEEALAEVRAHDSELVASAARLREEAADHAAKAERVEQEAVALRGERAVAETAMEAARARTTRAAVDAAEARQTLKVELDASERAHAESAEARGRATALAERVAAAQAELDALTERADRSGALGERLVASGWRSLVEAVRAPDEAWPAIEAVVGGELSEALMWRDADPGRVAADARGTARLLDGRPPPDRAERDLGLAPVRAERTLADWIGVREVPGIFARVAVAPHLEALLEGWRALPLGWSAVTPEGDLADGRGLVALRGRADPPGGAAARQLAHRRQVAEDLAVLEPEYATAANGAAAAVAVAAAAQRRSSDAQRTADAADNEARQAEAEADATRRTLERVTQDEARLSSAREALAASTEDRLPRLADRPAPSARAEREELEGRAEKARAGRIAAATERDEITEAWQAARRALDDLERATVGARQHRAEIAARRGQLEAVREEAASALAALRADRASTEAELAEANSTDSAASARRSEAEAERERGRAELLRLEREGSGAGGRLAELEHAHQAAVVETSRHEEALAALAREREMALETFTPEATGVREPSIGAQPIMGEPSAEIASLDPAALEAEQRRIRRLLGQIGSVNPFAVEEHREHAGRLEALSGQETDLRAAMSATRELIARLESEIDERFAMAFRSIGERFDEFVKLLFAGGSASLETNDGEEGEPSGGIEIVVRPPGKRPQRLAMLSGGERALTGVALLFAMLSVNPVPFCILDEVDAALDEANIGRFAQALRRLAEQIDFVVITHNRATIEVADTIYGVTMTDAAVSRVVSLRLADLPAEVTA